MIQPASYMSRAKKQHGYCLHDIIYNMFSSMHAPRPKCRHELAHLSRKLLRELTDLFLLPPFHLLLHGLLRAEHLEQRLDRCDVGRRKPDQECKRDQQSVG